MVSNTLEDRKETREWQEGEEGRGVEQHRRDNKNRYKQRGEEERCRNLI